MLRVVFMGSPDFAVPAFWVSFLQHEVVLVVTQGDKPAGRGRAVTEPPVKKVAREAGIPVIQPRSARKPEVAEELRQTGADLGIVVAYGKILPRSVLDAFPLGCINIHASLLPAYRGAAPVQWALIRGEIETGVTTMKLDEGMDTGPMLIRRAVAIEPEDTAGSLAEKLASVGAEALLETLDRLEEGTLKEIPQDNSRATYAPMLKKEDGAVDWRRSAEEVKNLVRGVDPWPGATARLGGQTLKLYGARTEEGRGAPGEILAADRRGLVVACGEGAVALAEVQAPGKKRMPAAEFARGRRLEAGTVLGGGPGADGAD